MKRNSLKILLASVVLGVSATFAFTPFTTVAQATEQSETAAFPYLTLTIEEDPTAPANMLNPKFIVKNEDKIDANLKDVHIIYAVANGSKVPVQANVLYAGTLDGEYKTLTNSVTTKVEDVKEGDVNHHLVIGFKDGVLKAGQSMEIMTIINNADWSYFNVGAGYLANHPVALK